MENPSTSHGTNDNDQYVFDVFINHRGPDVKRTLATALYHCLTQHDLRVFLDEQELQEGENITPQIESAIRTASVHIAIFSPGYADSRWCLDELVLMLESRSKSRSTIIPVFYGVQPSELRWTRSKNGVYARSLCVLEEKKTSDGRPRYDSSIIEKWRIALSEAAEIKGFDRETYNGVMTGVLQCLEAVCKLCNLPLIFRAEQLLEDVVEGVLKNVKRMLPVSEYPIGLEEKLEEFETTLSLEHKSGKARVLGIVGLGGVGKTTLAKEFFNRQRSNYKLSYFLFDIRENSLTTLQSNLLKGLNQSNEQIHSIDEGKRKLKRYLSSSHALIILDDVDHIRQLDALLLPVKDVLNTRSLILVTSRNKDVLTSSDIPESSIYRLTGLSRQHSRELFCSHAFSQPRPAVGFDKVVEKFLDACQELPLSVKVLGALLRGKNDLNYWEAQLRKIANMLHKDIQSTLKISYDGLDEEEKQIFLDIACFFTGEDRDTAIRIWNGCRWEGRLGLRNLENRCLVEFDEENRIRMHNHLQDLGRILAEKEPPGGELRFWRPIDNLDNPSGQSTVRGISMVHGNDPEQSFRNLAEIAGSCFVSNMSRLKLLRAEGGFVERLFSVAQLQQLIYLRWENCLNSSLPSSTPIKNLRVLYVQGKFLKTLWQHESQAPLQLRELYIDAPLSDVPNSIGKLKHLEKLVLYQSYFESLPNEFCNLHSLKHIGLKYCQKMTLLPVSIGNLENLQKLDLRGCSSLQTLPHSVGNLRGIQSLDCGWCSTLKMLPDSVGSLTGLQSLDLGGCSTLQMLPDSVGNLTGLQRLDLSWCSTLKRLPDSVGNLTGLQSLNLYECSTLQRLPESFGNLTGLQQLELYGCSITDSIGNLKGLKRLDLYECSTMHTFPEWVGSLTCLQRLALYGCSPLQTLPDWFGNLTGLQDLDLGGCFTLQTLPDSVGKLTGLQSLDLGGCLALHTLPDSIGNLTSLQCLAMVQCSTLQTLPDSVGNLTGLQSLNLSACSTLRMLPDSVGSLTGLQSLALSGCSTLQKLSDSVGNLIGLQSLALGGCSTLHTLPDSFGNLTGLQTLMLDRCSNLRMLPDSIRKMTGLQSLQLGGCSTLQTLPDWVGNLTGLQSLAVRGCPTLQTLPDSVGNLTDLQSLTLNGCSTLQTLPDSVGNLTDLQSLTLNGCSTLQRLPDSVGDLPALEFLNLYNCSNLQRLPNVEHLCSLKKLAVSQCYKLQWGAGVVEQLRRRLGKGFHWKNNTS